MGATTALSSTEVRARFSPMGVWASEGDRSPLKALLLLYTLGRYVGGGHRLIDFERLEKDLAKLFGEFGPPGREYDPVIPFWGLQDDGVWDIDFGADGKRPSTKASPPTKAWLRKHGVSGGLLPDFYGALAGDAVLLRDVAGDLLEAHFPGTLHGEIMAAARLDPALGMPPSRRDTKFRDVVLKAYRGRCAVCAFDARLGDALVGLEAAHIQWHQAGGPAEVSNGLALCSLHHRLFDRGAFTLSDESKVVVSQSLQGTGATEKWVTRYHGTTLRLPRRAALRPDPTFMAWHRREVFREPGRAMT